MKKLLFIAALVFSFVACEEDKIIDEEIQHTNNKCEDLPFEEESEPEQELYIDIVDIEIELAPDEQYQLELIVEGVLDGELTWEAEEDCYTVDENGLVTAIEPGSGRVFLRKDGEIIDDVYISINYKTWQIDWELPAYMSGEVKTVNISKHENIVELNLMGYDEIRFMLSPYCMKECNKREAAGDEAFMLREGHFEGYTYILLMFNRQNLDEKSIFEFCIDCPESGDRYWFKVVQDGLNETQTETGVKVITM